MGGIFKALFLVLVGIWVTVFIMRRSIRINDSTKTCLVTGVSSGIGLEIAKEMVKRGWRVIGIARRTEKLATIEEDLGKDSFIPYICDVSSSEQIHEVSEDIKKQGFRPTLFYLNAGTDDADEKWKFSAAVHKKVLAVNYFGVIAWIEEWLNDVRQYGGGIFVATSSVLALLSPPGAAAYSTSKAAVNACFQSLRFQYRNDNIRFSVVLPGPVKTEMLKNGENLPFKQEPEECAKYIVDGALKGDQNIEPAWFYSVLLRLLSLLPDEVVGQIF